MMTINYESDQPNVGTYAGIQNIHGATSNILPDDKK